MNKLNKKVQNSVDDYVEEENFEQLLEAFDKSRENATTEGVIVEIKNDEVYVDIGKKSESILALNEIQDESGKLIFNIGDRIKIAVIGSR
ncbi:MAG: S1 RNA-binding domain-containing protein, partial [Campylobacter sp.]|nr:S1 RNA-binding domain-containing protein [Campylobacter sp.]